MITPIYGVDPDDPLGLSEKPKKKLTSSKELLKQGPALSPDTESTIPFLKPVRSAPAPMVKPAPRLASQMRGADLLPRPGTSPVHDLLRRTKGTVEEAMSKWDADNPDADPVARRAFKQQIVAYASGSTGMTKNLQQAGRGKLSLYDAFLKDAPAQQKARSGAEDVRFASQKASDIGAAAANIGPSPVPSGVRSGVGRFAAAALDPFQQIESTGEMIKNPASATEMVTAPIETLADPSKSLEEKTMAGLGLGAAALPLLPPAARMVGGRLPVKPPPMDLPGVQFRPKRSQVPGFEFSDPLGLNESPAQKITPKPETKSGLPPNLQPKPKETPKAAGERVWVRRKLDNQTWMTEKRAKAYLESTIEDYGPGSARLEQSPQFPKQWSVLLDVTDNAKQRPDLYQGPNVVRDAPPAGAKPAQTPPVKGKEPWEMTREEFESNTPIVKREYQGKHEAPVKSDETSSPLWDITRKGSYPEDVYSPGAQRLYSSGYDALDAEALSIINSVRNNSAADVTVYRAVPKSVKGNGDALIKPGDWVTLTRGYANQHGMSNLNGEYRIVSRKVKSRDIFTDGNSLQEFGYDPQPIDHRQVVARAAKTGKPVPAEVLADYPDLAKKYGADPTIRESRTVEPPKVEEPPAAKPTKPKKPKVESLASPIRELRSSSPGPRIDPAPIPGGKPKKVGEIALDLSKGVGRKLSFGGQSPRSQGTYYPGTAATVVKYAGDLDTTAHEIAHALDDQFGIVGDWAKPRAKSPFDAEIRKPEFQQTTRPSHSLTIKRAEGVAEWIRAWLVNPDAAEAAAPNFAAHFKSKLPPDKLKALETFGNDIRTLAGADAKDQIMANVRWEPPKDGLTGWLKNVRDPGGPGFELTFWDRVQQKWQDSLKPFTKATGYLKDQRGTGDLAPSKDPEILARLTAGASSKMDDIFANGMLDAKGNRVGKGFESLISDLEGRTAAALNEEMQDVASYMIAQRTLEKQAQTGKSRVSGIGGGITDEGRLAAKRIADVQADPEKFARIEKAAKAYRDWSDNVLQYLRDKGRISSKAYDQIKANNEYYVAMKRIMEVGPEEEIVSFRGRGGNALASHSDPIKKFKGSTRQIQNPYEALIEATYKAIKEADRNETLQAFFDLAKPERGMYEGAVQDFASVARKANSGDKHNVVTVYRDGKAERWVIPDADLYKAFKGITDNPTILPIWATLPAKVLRWGVTNFPTFAIRNKIRDVINTAIISDHKTNVWDMLKKKAPEVFEDFRKSGGGQFGTYMNDPKAYYGKMDAAVKEIAASRNTIVLHPGELAKKGAKGYRALIEGAEVSTRLAEFEKAKKHAIDKMGMGEHDANLYAASKARDLMDFAVAGEFIKYINQVIPFTNASVQGMTRAVKSVRKNPASTAARWGMYVMVPIAAEKAWNASQGHQKEYEQLPSYQKDLFWNFKVGPDMWLSVPKPFEFGVIGGLFGRGMDKALGDEKAFEGYGRSATEAILPVGKTDLLGGPLSGVMGAAANYDFFRERPIVPPYEEDKALEHRKGTEKASRLGQLIQSVFGIDARKADHMIRSQFGYAGKYATELSDLGREDKKSGAQMGMEFTGILRPGPSSAARDVTWLGEYAHEQGIAQRKEYKQLRELVSAYYDAKSQGEKAKAGVDLREYATELRLKWEKEKPTKDTPVPEKSKAPELPKGAPDIGKKIRSNLTPKLP